MDEAGGADGADEAGGADEADEAGAADEADEVGTGGAGRKKLSIDLELIFFLKWTFCRDNKYIIVHCYCPTMLSTSECTRQLCTVSSRGPF